MLCPQCGASNNDFADICAKCGASLANVGPYGAPKASSHHAQIPNHLVKAVLATLFCCLPLGIVAIVFAAQVDGQASSGNIEQAQRSSEQANMWGNLSIGLGFGVTVLYILLVAAAGVQ